MRKYLLFGLVVLLAGCGAESPPADAPSSAPPSSPVLSAAPVELPKDMAEYVPSDTAMAASRLASGSARNSYFISDNTPLILLSVCGEAHPWDGKAKAGESVSWRAGTTGEGSAKQLIGQYDGVTGAEVVNGIKQAMSCGHMKYRDDYFALKAEFPLPTLPGADAQFAFCGGYPQARDLGVCVLLIASGDRASSFVSDDFSQTERQRKATLTAAAPALAAALAKA